MPLPHRKITDLHGQAVNVPILEIARQRPDATRVAGLYAWNQMGRKVKKGEKGIRILAPIVGVRRKNNEEAEKDATKQNTAVLVGFRSAYVFDVSQTDGADLPEMRQIQGDVGENCDRLVAFIERQGIELMFSENIAPALGMSYGGRIAIQPNCRMRKSFPRWCMSWRIYVGSKIMLRACAVRSLQGFRF